jgi:hypothetical protein
MVLLPNFFCRSALVLQKKHRYFPLFRAGVDSVFGEKGNLIGEKRKRSSPYIPMTSQNEER